MFILLLFINVWANEPLDFSVKKQVFMLDTQFTIDDKTQRISCDAYGNSNPKILGIKARFQGPKKMAYAIDCKSNDIGAHFDLHIYKKEEKISSVEHVTGGGSDAGDTYLKGAWLVDLNRDSYFDLILRSKGSNSEIESPTPPTKTDRFEVFYWDSKTNAFILVKIHAKKMVSVKSTYNFQGP